MRRRSRASSKPAKARSRKAMLKRRNAPKAKRSRGVSIAGQEKIVARLTRDGNATRFRGVLKLAVATAPGLHLIRTIFFNDANGFSNLRRHRAFYRLHDNGMRCRHLEVPAALRPAPYRASCPEVRDAANSFEDGDSAGGSRTAGFVLMQKMRWPDSGCTLHSGLA